MPISEAELQFTAALPYDQFTLPVEKGDLTSVSVMQTPGEAGPRFAYPAAFYGAIYLADTNLTVPIPMILLAEGRFGSHTCVSWHGRIKMEPSSVLVALIAGYQASAFTLRAHKELP